MYCWLQILVACCVFHHRTVEEYSTQSHANHVVAKGVAHAGRSLLQQSMETGQDVRLQSVSESQDASPMSVNLSHASTSAASAGSKVINGTGREFASAPCIKNTTMGLSTALAVASQAALGVLALLAVEEVAIEEVPRKIPFFSSKGRIPLFLIVTCVLAVIVVIGISICHRRGASFLSSNGESLQGRSSFSIPKTLASERFFAVTALESLVLSHEVPTTFEINDLQGEQHICNTQTLQASVRLPGLQRGSVLRPGLLQGLLENFGVMMENAAVELSTVLPDGKSLVHARCYFQGDVSGFRTVRILDRDGSLFAVLVRDPTAPLYFLKSNRLSMQLCFEGSFDKHVIKVTNQRHERLADTGPVTTALQGERYRLRLAPKAEWPVIVLIVCGVLAIDVDEFEAQAAERERLKQQSFAPPFGDAHSVANEGSGHC